MKCTHCDNVSLSRYGFILSTIFFKSNNAIECDKCNNLSKIKEFELLFLRLIVYLFIVGAIFVIATLNQFSYSENILAYFSLAFIAVISSSIFINLIEGSKSNIKKVYKNISNEKNINNKKFVFIYMIFLFVFIVVSFLIHPLFVELGLGFILSGSISIVLIPTLVTVLMYKLFPKKKELIIKILKIKKYIVFAFILFISFNIFTYPYEEEFSRLNSLYFILLPFVFTLLVMLFLEKQIIERGKLTVFLSFGLFIILTIQIATSMSFYIDREEYYLNIYNNGMTINNRLQQLVSSELLNKEEIKNAIAAYKSN